jgi:hypothetical protein
MVELIICDKRGTRSWLQRVRTCNAQRYNMKASDFLAFRRLSVVSQDRDTDRIVGIRVHVYGRNLLHRRGSRCNNSSFVCVAGRRPIWRKSRTVRQGIPQQ